MRRKSILCQRTLAFCKYVNSTFDPMISMSNIIKKYTPNSHPPLGLTLRLTLRFTRNEEHAHKQPAQLTRRNRSFFFKKKKNIDHTHTHITRNIKHLDLSRLKTTIVYTLRHLKLKCFLTLGICEKSRYKKFLLSNIYNPKKTNFRFFAQEIKIVVSLHFFRKKSKKKHFCNFT